MCGAVRYDTVHTSRDTHIDAYGTQVIHTYLKIHVPRTGNPIQIPYPHIRNFPESVNLNPSHKSRVCRTTRTTISWVDEWTARPGGVMNEMWVYGHAMLNFGVRSSFCCRISITGTRRTSRSQKRVKKCWARTKKGRRLPQFVHYDMSLTEPCFLVSFHESEFKSTTQSPASPPVNPPNLHVLSACNDQFYFN